jgi:hypothetical protein
MVGPRIPFMANIGWIVVGKAIGIHYEINQIFKAPIAIYDNGESGIMQLPLGMYYFYA